MKENTDIFVDTHNARFDDQRKVLQQIIADRGCPFCGEKLFKYHKKPILKEGKFWILTENQWPHDNTKINLLAIYKEHAESLAEINPDAGKELVELFQWAEKEYSVPGGGFAMRFGDTRYSAGTVKHIHAQFFVPDREKPDYKPVRFKIGAKK